MLKNIIRVVLLIVFFIFLGYLLLPNPGFPTPPPDSLKSLEPADTETPLRQAFFTNYTREQILTWYKNQFEQIRFLGIRIPGELLNYPPEEAVILIRDQTRSSYLQEVVHPFRESVYINGFQPSADDTHNAININGKHWLEKITVKYVPSPVYIRVAIFLAVSVLILAIFYSLKEAFADILKLWRKQ